MTKQEIPPKLLEYLHEIACTPILLLASDYDGTLAPIVADPKQAKPIREAIVALKALAELPQTHVTVISGRSLHDLANLMGETEGIHLVGSHGSEFDPGFIESLSPAAKDLHRQLINEVKEICKRDPGFLIEEKPASVAFHYRNAHSEGAAQQAIQALLDGPASYQGVSVRQGKKVLELSVMHSDKGKALNQLRHRFGATAAIFIGDDRTDEDAFAVMTGPDVAIKVGDGETLAHFRISDTDMVVRLLAKLAEQRLQWLLGNQAVPIEKHTLLSDQRTTALLTPDARITWFCVPRMDSSALFAELLGGPTAGYFAIYPPNRNEKPQQRYEQDSLVVRTEWASLSVVDYLDCSRDRSSQRAGRSDLIRVLEGQGTAIIEFAPRVDFGRTSTQMQIRNQGLVIEGTPDPIVLHAPGITWTLTNEGNHQTARAEVELDLEPVVLELRYGTGDLRDDALSERERRHQTLHFWTSWCERLQLPRIATKHVRRSALTLKALCYRPKGSIAAAATTSLPEMLGGVRNWDYRFCWLRDGALSAYALAQLGSTSEAMSFLGWVLDVLDECPGPERLRPFYTLSGREPGPEAEIAELSGYAGSRPVRINNAAVMQVQLDVFGPIVDLIYVLVQQRAAISSEHWRLVQAMVQAVQKRWHEPDHGIWEIRTRPRHLIHSKTMCWLTVDRAIHIANDYLGQQKSEWLHLREQIAQDILQNGFKPEVNAFTAAYDGDDMDAATLWVGLSGLLPPDDPRFISTVQAVEHHLKDGIGVYRYFFDDGLPGAEGAFLLCTCWLIDAYLLIGRKQDAKKLFEQLVSIAGPTGLYAEEIDPRNRTALGNFPQAYTHLGLILNAINLERNH